MATLTYVYADSTAVLGPLALRAAPGETQELVVRRGSPAREVNAGSSCQYD